MIDESVMDPYDPSYPDQSTEVQKQYLRAMAVYGAPLLMPKLVELRKRGEFPRELSEYIDACVHAKQAWDEAHKDRPYSYVAGEDAVRLFDGPKVRLLEISNLVTVEVDDQARRDICFWHTYKEAAADVLGKAIPESF